LANTACGDSGAPVASHRAEECHLDATAPAAHALCRKRNCMLESTDEKVTTGDQGEDETRKTASLTGQRPQSGREGARGQVEMLALHKRNGQRRLRRSTACALDACSLSRRAASRLPKGNDHQCCAWALKSLPTGAVRRSQLAGAASERAAGRRAAHACAPAALRCPPVCGAVRWRRARAGGAVRSRP
jgi:hypothetical protein